MVGSPVVTTGLAVLLVWQRSLSIRRRSDIRDCWRGAHASTNRVPVVSGEIAARMVDSVVGFRFDACDQVLGGWCCEWSIIFGGDAGVSFL